MGCRESTLNNFHDSKYSALMSVPFKPVGREVLRIGPLRAHELGQHQETLKELREINRTLKQLLAIAQKKQEAELQVEGHVSSAGSGAPGGLSTDFKAAQ